MASNTKVNSKKISAMVRVDSSGVMVVNTRVAGIAESKVASDTTLTSTESNERATGLMVDVNAGWTMRVIRSEHPDLISHNSVG